MNKKKDIVIAIIFVLVMAIVIACLYFTSLPTELENPKVYPCDYKTISLNTSVSTTVDGKDVTISGNILKLVTDPLVMKDADGNVLANAGDTYGFFAQDSHAIYVDGNFEVNMCGEISLFGEKYSLKDSEGTVIGYANFNVMNTAGEITTPSGTVVATFSSKFGFNDYDVSIIQNDICSDKAILMIMASYMSDYKYDQKSSSNSSKK